MGFLNFGYSISFQLFDKGVIEYIGPTGLVSSTFQISRIFSTYQSGFLYQSTFLLVISLIVFASIVSLQFINVTFVFDFLIILGIYVLLIN